MKKLLAFIVFLLFLLLLWLSWGWYKDTVVCCGEGNGITEQVNYGPLVFDCTNAEKVVTNDLWPEKRKEILDLRKSGQNLLIVAPYFDGENESKAMMRALAVANLFKPDLTDEEITVNIRKGGDCEKTKANLMHESRYSWFTRTGNVVRYKDFTAINYEYDSTQEVPQGDIVAYFDELATELKESGKSVTLTGHTDSDGEAAYNMDLGLKRAEEFKKHLLNRGVSEDKIMTESKGESMPIATNSTPKGKKQNRRVEIRINN